MPVLDPRLQRELVVPGEGAVAARGTNDRGAQELGDGQQLGLGAGAADAAAGDDDRAPGVGKPAHGLVDKFHARRVLVGLGQRVDDGRDQHRSEQHVLGHLDPDRALRHGDGIRPGVLDGRGNPRGVVHGALGLGDVRGRGLLVIELVQHALAAGAQSVQRNLAGHHDDRHAGRVGFLQAGERGQRAGTRGQEEHAHLSGRPRVAVGGEGRVVFHAGGNEVQVRTGQGVKEPQGVLARDAEDGLGAERLERLDDEVAAVAVRQLPDISEVIR